MKWSCWLNQEGNFHCQISVVSFAQCRNSTRFWLTHKQFYSGCLWEKFFYSCLRQKILTELWNNFLIDNHYETIFVSVRMACSSSTVIWEAVTVRYHKSEVISETWKSCKQHFFFLDGSCRVALVIAFAFLSKTIGKVLRTYKWYFCQSVIAVWAIGDGDTQTLIFTIKFIWTSCNQRQWRR